VVSCVRSMIRLSALAQTVGRLEHEAKKGRVLGHPPELGFLKRVLLMEVKRSRRYRYPISFLMVAVDAATEGPARGSEKEHAALLGKVLGAITRGLREIDIALPASDERFLIFLPHTPREGALVAAERMRSSVGRLKQLEGRGLSIGIACYDGTPATAQVSFGSLMKEATEALRRAQKAGGNRVELSGGRAKRDRISLG